MLKPIRSRKMLPSSRKKERQTLIGSKMESREMVTRKKECKLRTETAKKIVPTVVAPNRSD